MGTDLTIIRVHQNIPRDVAGLGQFFTRCFDESDGTIARAFLALRIAPVYERKEEYGSFLVWQLTKAIVLRVTKHMYSQNKHLADKYPYDAYDHALELDELFHQEGEWFVLEE